MTLTIKNLSYETLELRVHGGDAPDQRILDIQFLAEEGERLPMRLQEMLRLDATGHGIEVNGPGSLYPGRSIREVQACMKVYADKLEQEEYVGAAARGYSLWIQFYEQSEQEGAA